MALHDLKPNPGARKQAKRKGRGPGSGNGKTAGKGHKGHKARSGGQTQRGFEGGQMPLHRRLPKRGFTNAQFKKTYDIVNVSDLAKFEAGTVVDWETLNKLGRTMRKDQTSGLKVLGRGDIGVALTVRAAKFSDSAVRKIEAAGGTAEVV